MRLLFLHGWGLDAALWNGVRAALPQHEAVVWDRGYFGAPAEPPVAAPFVAIGHSLGAMLLARVEGASALVAINGFDRFAGGGAVAPRVIDRMRRRFAAEPHMVLDDFRRRIGAGAAPETPDTQRLAHDLALLADGDARDVRRPPTLVLHGGDDPLLPEAMRHSVFAGAERATLAGAGHLLPASHPDWCAERIMAFFA